jgi:hypothetical protein
MPVTFGAVQIVPPPSQPTTPSAAAATPAGQQPPPPDPRDLDPVMRKLHERAARVRAH